MQWWSCALNLRPHFRKKVHDGRRFSLSVRIEPDRVMPAPPVTTSHHEIISTSKDELFSVFLWDFLGWTGNARGI